jgi:hypothetical protein
MNETFSVTENIMKKLSTGLFLLLPMTASATVDFLSANKITKEYYWGDEDHSTGWIGWTSVSEGQLDTAVADLKKLGYTETFYPYKIESYIFSLILILLLGRYIVRTRSKRTSTTTANKSKSLS